MRKKNYGRGNHFKQRMIKRKNHIFSLKNDLKKRTEKGATKVLRERQGSKGLKSDLSYTLDEIYS